MSVITETPAVSIQEKAARARLLIEQVRSMNLDTTTDESGINSGEKAKEARSKMEEATRLASEVKEMRQSSDAEVAKSLLEKFNLDDANADSQWGAQSDSTLGTKGLLSGSSSSNFDPLQQQFLDEGGYKDPRSQINPLSAKSRITMTEKAVERMAVLKALSEGTTTAGGFLVPPQWMQELFAEVRRQGNALRRYGWLNIHPVTTNQILLPKGSGAASVGWVAENATKPSADQTFAQVTVNIFTAAGISKLSKQLVDDSSPTAVDLATRELASLMGVLEEQAIVNGSGSGQPRGILNTTGTNLITVATNTALAIFDALLDGLVAIQTSYYGAPNGALVSPRRLAFLQKARDTQGRYLIEAGARGSGLLNTQTPVDIMGIPVGVSTNVPTNLGGTTNQDAIILGDWNEAHWFQRQDQTLDASDQAGTAFEQNQVWFRLEERAGFSAERYPAAFAVLTGAGLVP